MNNPETWAMLGTRHWIKTNKIEHPTNHNKRPKVIPGAHAEKHAKFVWFGY